MEVAYYKYQNTDLSVYFRGYIKKYQGNKLLVKTCGQVRKTRAEALKDARRLLKIISI